jgi:2-polyprenyl-6-methoxyphenol hydroxylase-like FAD-dependent oxidoreductase
VQIVRRSVVSGEQPGWTGTRDFPEPPAETIRDWWRRERGESAAPAPRRAPDLDLPPLWRSIQIASKDRADRPAGDARHTILAAIASALADRPTPVEVPRRTAASRSALARKTVEERAAARSRRPGAAYCASPMSGQGSSLALIGAYLLAGELAAASGDHGAASPSTTS